MTELPLSVNDYEKSVALVNLLTMKKRECLTLPYCMAVNGTFFLLCPRRAGTAF